MHPLNTESIPHYIFWIRVQHRHQLRLYVFMFNMKFRFDACKERIRAK